MCFFFPACLAGTFRLLLFLAAVGGDLMCSMLCAHHIMMGNEKFLKKESSFDILPGDAVKRVCGRAFK